MVVLAAAERYSSPRDREILKLLKPPSGGFLLLNKPKNAPMANIYSQNIRVNTNNYRANNWA